MRCCDWQNHKAEYKTQLLLTEKWRTLWPCCYFLCRFTYSYWWAGIAQWLERRTRDRKVSCSSPGRNGGRNFFSRVSFLCWLLYRCSVHPRVTLVAHIKSQSFCQKNRWQVTAKQICSLRMRLRIKWRCKLVHGCMVDTEHAPKQ